MGEIDIKEKQRLLEDALRRFGATMVGFCSVGDLEPDICTKYPIGIAIALDYDKRAVALLTEDDHSFEREAQAARNRLYRIYGLATQLLKCWGYGSIPISDTIPAETLPKFTSEIPLKTIATRAGLGWIGKSCLLVTGRYGPRVRLGAILTDAPFQSARQPMESKCGDCSLCVSACPAGALKGVDWHPGVERDDMLDYEACNNWRRESLATLGRKSACAYCMAACPIGADEGFGLSYIGPDKSGCSQPVKEERSESNCKSCELSPEEIAFLKCDDDLLNDVAEEPVALFDLSEVAASDSSIPETPEIEAEKAKKKPRPRRRPKAKPQQTQLQQKEDSLKGDSSLETENSSNASEGNNRPVENKKPRAPRRLPKPKDDVVKTDNPDNS